MIFTTLQFLAFFVAFLLVFSLGPPWLRRPLLLAGSYYFYMCSVPWYVAVILAITLIDFLAGIRIEESASPRARKAWLLLSLAANLGLLFVFKYAGFFATEIRDAFGVGVPVLRFALPLGLSFHTFQAISYTVEVYRGRVPAERNLLTYALYVAFFPQMVAGPIERPYNLLPQLRANPVASIGGFRSGLRWVLWGVYKKLVVADLLASAVATVYEQPRHFSGPILLLATFFFSIQIYCDFSGYSDIAVGIARMMGYDLMVNFRQPYFATSIADFWRRWHISLTSWFRDYVYIPLGGGRTSAARRIAVVLLVFALSGLWHGANWTFVAWGVLHGVYYVAGYLTADWRSRAASALGLGPSSRVHAAWKMAVTFCLVGVAWVFFRAANVADALYIVGHFGAWAGYTPLELVTMGMPKLDLVLALLLIGSVAWVEWQAENGNGWVARSWESSRPLRWASYYACILAIVCFGVFEHSPFIYFQF